MANGWRRQSHTSATDGWIWFYSKKVGSETLRLSFGLGGQRGQSLKVCLDMSGQSGRELLHLEWADGQDGYLIYRGEVEFFDIFILLYSEGLDVVMLGVLELIAQDIQSGKGKKMLEIEVLTPGT